MADQIEDAAECGVKVFGPSRLNKEDATSKVINHRLKAIGAPPFDRVVSLPSRDDYPIGDVTLQVSRDHGGKKPFLARENNFSPALGWVNPGSENGVEMAAKTMKEVTGKLVALQHERIAGIYPLGFRRSFRDGADVGMMMPEIGERSSNIRQELARMATMEVPHRSREHDDVPW